MMKYLKLYVVYLFVIIKTTKQNVTSVTGSLMQIQDTENRYTKCIENVVINYRLTQEETIVSNLNLKGIFRKNIININLDKGCLLTTRHNLQLYILDLRDDENLNNFYQQLKQQCFNSRAKYLFITIFHTAAEIEVFLKILSHAYICKVAVIDLEFNVFTYFPYRHENVLNPDLKPVKIGPCSEISKYADFLNTHAYPELWRNTTIQSYFKLIKPYANEVMTGSEQRVLSEIIKKLGMKIVPTFGHHKFQGIENNGTYQDEGLSLLQKKVVQVVAGGYEADSNLWKDFDFSPVTFIDSIRIFTPKSQEVGPWIRLLRMFTSKSIFTLLGIAAFWSIFVKFAYGGDVFNLLFIVMALYNQQPVYNIGQYKFKITLYFTILGFFFISCSEIALVKKIFFTVLYAPEINSVADALSSGLPILVSSEVFQSFNESDRKLDKQLSQRMEPCLTDIFKCLSRVCIDGNAILIAPATPMVQQAVDICFDSLTGHKMYHLGEKIGDSYLQLYFNKGYPPHKSLYQAIKRFVLYGGISIKEQDHTFYSYQKVLTTMPKFKSDSMQLKHLQLLLLVWFIGILFSILILLIEIYLWKRSK